MKSYQELLIAFVMETGHMPGEVNRPALRRHRPSRECHCQDCNYYFKPEDVHVKEVQESNP